MSNWNSPPVPTLTCPHCGCDHPKRVEVTNVGGYCSVCGRNFTPPKAA